MSEESCEKAKSLSVKKFAKPISWSPKQDSLEGKNEGMGRQAAGMPTTNQVI